jgi:hypothetical protein
MTATNRNCIHKKIRSTAWGILGKIPFGRPRHRWEDGIRMDLRETGWGNVDWIQLAQDRDQWWALVNTVKNLLVVGPWS